MMQLLKYSVVARHVFERCGHFVGLYSVFGVIIAICYLFNRIYCSLTTRSTSETIFHIDFVTDLFKVV